MAVAQVGLEQIAQSDFSLGAVQSVARHLIPGSGAYAIQNGLLGDDGSITERGGSVSLSTADFGASGNRFIWDGYLSALRRTVIANSAAFGVLDGSEAPVSLGGSGLSGPVRAVEIDGILFVGGGVLYGGSLKAADYSTGTVTVTNGSKVVTGSSSLWAANADAGMLFKRGSERYYTVASVDSNTQITLNQPYQGVTGSGIAYGLTRLGATSSSTYKTASIYAVCANKLVACSGNRIDVSNGPAVADGHLQPDVNGATSFLLLPEGSQIVGAESVGQALLVFSTSGVWKVSNLALDIADANGNIQWRMDQVSRDVILWSNESISTWQNALVIGAADGAYLFDGVSAPRLLSRSITPKYVGYVRSGYHTGLAEVFSSKFGPHYVVPILDGNNVVVDTLVCRLDRPHATPFGEMFPWSWMAGSGANCAAYAIRTGTATRQPELLGAGRQTSGRVLKVSGWWDPAAAIKNDHDGTTPILDVTLRDIATGGGNPNTVMRLRARYELTDAASDNPMLLAYGSTGAKTGAGSFWGTATWGSSATGTTGDWTDSSLTEFTQLGSGAPEDDGRDPYAWPTRASCRFYRARFQSSGPNAKLVLRSVELFVLPTGRV